MEKNFLIGKLLGNQNDVDQNFVSSVVAIRSQIPRQYLYYQTLLKYINE